jgi:hypothetical protein
MVGLINNALLGIRDHHVVLAERNAGAAGLTEAEPIMRSAKITVSF